MGISGNYTIKIGVAFPPDNKIYSAEVDLLYLQKNMRSDLTVAKIAEAVGMQAKLLVINAFLENGVRDKPEEHS